MLPPFLSSTSTSQIKETAIINHSLPRAPLLHHSWTFLPWMVHSSSSPPLLPSSSPQPSPSRNIHPLPNLLPLLPLLLHTLPILRRLIPRRHTLGNHHPSPPEVMRSLVRMNRLNILFARNIPPDILARPCQCLTAFPDGEQSDTDKRAEDPDYADDDPPREKGLGEDVAGSVEGHGPED